MYGRGELELFEKEPSEDKSFCAVCHYITFEEKGINIPMEEFTDYLNTRKYRGKETYVDFLRGYSTEGEEIDADLADESFIDTGTPYGVFFVYNKKAYADPLSSTIEGLVVGTSASILVVGGLLLSPITLGASAATGVILGGMVIGAYAGYETSDETKDWNSYVVLYPYEEEHIKRLKCTDLPVKQK
jgi:hypothetical protein